MGTFVLSLQIGFTIIILATVLWAEISICELHKEYLKIINDRGEDLAIAIFIFLLSVAALIFIWVTIPAFYQLNS